MIKKTSKVCHMTYVNEGDQHAWLCQNPLTHFLMIFPFYTPWKPEKSKGFLMFSRGIKHTVPLTISYHLFLFVIG